MIPYWFSSISTGSYEQSPSLLEAYPSWPETSIPVQSGEVAEERLRERLADAMIEAPMKEGGPTSKHGNACVSSPSYQMVHVFIRV